MVAPAVEGRAALVGVEALDVASGQPPKGAETAGRAPARCSRPAEGQPPAAELSDNVRARAGAAQPHVALVQVRAVGEVEDGLSHAVESAEMALRLTAGPARDRCVGHAIGTKCAPRARRSSAHRDRMWRSSPRTRTPIQVECHFRNLLWEEGHAAARPGVASARSIRGESSSSGKRRKLRSRSKLGPGGTDGRPGAAVPRLEGYAGIP